MDTEKCYKIAVATPAQNRYQEMILPYLLEHFSIERAAEIDLSIARTMASLSSNPYLGTKERYLNHPDHDFRFLLHRESRNFEIKIIYFASKESETIFITDFFPTLMHPDEMVNP